MIQIYNGVVIHYMSLQETVQVKASGQVFPKRYIIIRWSTEGHYAKDIFRQIEAFAGSTLLLQDFQPGQLVNIEVELGGNLSTDKNTQAPMAWNKDKLKSIVAVGGQQPAPVAPQGQQQHPQQAIPGMANQEIPGQDNIDDQDIPF